MENKFKNIKLKYDNKDIVALHEASHAVIGILLGIDVVSAAVFVPNSKSYGLTDATIGAFDVADYNYNERNIIFKMAGVVGQRILNPDALPVGGKQDFVDIDNCISMIISHDQKLSLFESFNIPKDVKELYWSKYEKETIELVSKEISKIKLLSKYLTKYVKLSREEIDYILTLEN